MPCDGNHHSIMSVDGLMSSIEVIYVGNSDFKPFTFEGVFKKGKVETSSSTVEVLT